MNIEQICKNAIEVVGRYLAGDVSVKVVKEVLDSNIAPINMNHAASKIIRQVNSCENRHHIHTMVIVVNNFRRCYPYSIDRCKALAEIKQTMRHKMIHIGYSLESIEAILPMRRFKKQLE